MQKDDLVYAGHMLDMSRKALDLVRGKSRQDYNSDEALRFALAHLVQVIGEAARHVSKQFCDCPSSNSLESHCGDASQSRT